MVREFSGCIYLSFKNILYFWVGLSKTNPAGISPNDLIQWEAIRVHTQTVLNIMN